MQICLIMKIVVKERSIRISKIEADNPSIHNESYNASIEKLARLLIALLLKERWRGGA